MMREVHICSVFGEIFAPGRPAKTAEKRRFRLGKCPKKLSRSTRFPSPLSLYASFQRKLESPFLVGRQTKKVDFSFRWNDEEFTNEKQPRIGVMTGEIQH
jgi:hypothetical protein